MSSGESVAGTPPAADAPISRRRARGQLVRVLVARRPAPSSAQAPLQRGSAQGPFQQGSVQDPFQRASLIGRERSSGISRSGSDSPVPVAGRSSESRTS